jgi:Zn-dependent alcohol dehydrogenase
MFCIKEKFVEEFIHEIKAYAADCIEIAFNFAGEYERIAKVFDCTRKKWGASLWANLMQ